MGQHGNLNNMYRIVILGGESTGKSTLTEALASHYQTSYTIEFARPYLEKLQRPYEEEDLKDLYNIDQIIASLEAQTNEPKKGFA